MPYPDFFDAVPRLRLKDPLAEFLGAFDDGEVEYGYLNVVKLAGHSCPTVASAYWMTYRALAALYGKALAERGAIRVEFRDARLSGVTGVIANVVSMLTGATDNDGFKGLAGRFDRRNLLSFEADIPLELRYTRVDNGAQVDVAANVRLVPGDPETSGLMQRGLAGQADAGQAQRFASLWQDRVRRILLEYGDDPQVFVVRHVG